MNNTEQQNQSKKHRWHDVIVAWANGDTVQFKINDSEWRDYSNVQGLTPSFNESIISWRIKPKTVTKRYRMALVARESSRDVIAVETTHSTIDDPVEYNTLGFIRWVGDSVELEVESKV